MMLEHFKRTAWHAAVCAMLATVHARTIAMV
jgi:hypothetical protein